MGPRFVDDPREHHRLAGLQFDRAPERHPHLHVEVIAYAFPEFERPVVAPDPGCRPGHPAIGLHLLLRDGHNESVDIWHRTPPWNPSILHQDAAAVTSDGASSASSRLTSRL